MPRLPSPPRRTAATRARSECPARACSRPPAPERAVHRAAHHHVLLREPLLQRFLRALRAHAAEGDGGTGADLGIFLPRKEPALRIQQGVEPRDAAIAAQYAVEFEDREPFGAIRLADAAGLDERGDLRERGPVRVLSKRPDRRDAHVPVGILDRLL